MITSSASPSHVFFIRKHRPCSTENPPLYTGDSKARPAEVTSCSDADPHWAELISVLLAAQQELGANRQTQHTVQWEYIQAKRAAPSLFHLHYIRTPQHHSFIGLSSPRVLHWARGTGNEVTPALPLLLLWVNQRTPPFLNQEVGTELQSSS